MRIAHVITRMIVGGAQENTLFTCEDLIRDYGDDVLLITGPAIGPEGDLLGQGRGGEVPTSIISSLRREVHAQRDYASYRQLQRMLREFRPDVVHTHSAKGGMLGRLAAWSLRVPAVIHTVHGAPFHNYQSALARAAIRSCERYAARHCHALVSVAQAMTDQLVAARVAPREKFTTIYSGMDVEPFLAADRHRLRTRESLQFRPEHIVVGKIARLFHLKGQEYVIQAATEVVRQVPEVRFLFIGDGTQRAALEQQIERAGLTNYFRFTGLVAPIQIPEYLGAMDVVVHTSLREGLARALPQALIAGKPVVSFDIDGAREVVIPDRTGCLIAPENVGGLANAIIELAKDRDRRQRFGEAGRKLFSDLFRHQTMTRELRLLYERVLGQAASSS